jgi:hypothetical protein
MLTPVQIHKQKKLLLKPTIKKHKHSLKMLELFIRFVSLKMVNHSQDVTIPFSAPSLIPTTGKQ